MTTLEITKQRSEASRLVYDLTGKRLRHLESGRPFVDKSLDISISHKNDLVGVGIVPAPFRIGIDIEDMNVALNSRVFLGSAITGKEISYLKKFCKSKKIPISSGIAVFWSIKESFFKCLDHDLIPGEISIRDISRRGNIRLELSEDLSKIMTSRKLEIFSSEVRFEDSHIFSLTVMNKISGHGK